MSSVEARRPWISIVVGLVGVGAAFVVGLWPRLQARAAVRAETAEMAVPYVSVVHPERAAPTRDLVLPGNVQPFESAPIFARTNGYLQAWYFDIGAHVKKGQLLAVIATPEVDQQLQQARGALAVAEANLRLTETTAKRYTGLRQTNAVSQQDVDTAVGAYTASQASVQASRANVRQLEQLQSFEQVRAPFDGVITARNTDVGKLIDSGSAATQQTELFHIAQPDTLRVYVNVPEADSDDVAPGLLASLVLDGRANDHVTGTLVRTADAIDPATRTLLVEIDVVNPTGALLAGSYAEVHLTIPTAKRTFVLPVEALLFRKEGLNVATVRDGHVVLKSIVTGHDFGDRIEITQGLAGDDDVIVNPPDSIVAGEAVKLAAPGVSSGDGSTAGL